MLQCRSELLTIILALVFSTACLAQDKSRLNCQSVAQRDSEFEKCYSELKADRDQGWKLLTLYKNEAQKYDTILLELTGNRSYFRMDYKDIEDLVGRRFRETKFTSKDLDEYAWIFRNYLNGKGQLPETRSWYAYNLFKGKRIKVGMTWQQIIDILGTPDSEKTTTQENADVESSYLIPDFGQLKLVFQDRRLQRIETFSSTDHKTLEWREDQDKGVH